MNFDLTKFYQARASAGQLRGLFATLRKLDEFVKRARRRQLLTILGGIAVFIVLFGAAYSVDQRIGAAALTLSITGLTFVLVTTFIRRVFMRRSFGEVAAALFMTIITGGVLGGLSFVVTEMSRDALSEPRFAVPGAVLATAVVGYLFLVSSGARWSGLQPQAVELDYLEKILFPLYADLPTARAELVFNPFRGEWSRIKLPVPSRSGYSFEATADIILRLRMPLDEHRDLKLSIVEQTISKTKVRKAKYKGTKRRLLVRYDVQLAPGAQPEQSAVEKALADLGLAADRVVVGKDRITVVRVKKSADLERELLTKHLVSPGQVLGTIHVLTVASMPAAPTSAVSPPPERSPPA